MANQDMPRPIKLWVDALRSGKYKQTRRRLHDRYGFCCLGVLCEVAIENGVEVARTEDTELMWYDDHDSGLPNSVQEWAGLRDDLGYTNGFETILIDDDAYDSLTDANDGGVTFADIADAIETQWPKLVKETTNAND